MSTSTLKLDPPAQLESKKGVVEQRLEKSINDVISFFVSIVNIKKMITYFKN